VATNCVKTKRRVRQSLSRNAFRTRSHSRSHSFTVAIQATYVVDPRIGTMALAAFLATCKILDGSVAVKMEAAGYELDVVRVRDGLRTTAHHLHVLPRWHPNLASLV
jgi:hypothetical protein